MSYVEKQADVWIAVDLVSMAYRDEYDVAYLLSADADYVSAVREVIGMSKRCFPSGRGLFVLQNSTMSRRPFRSRGIGLTTCLSDS